MQIRYRLVVWISLAAALAFAGFAALMLAAQARDLDAKFEAKVGAYSKMVPELFKLNIWNMDTEAVRASADALVADPEISYLAVSDELGTPIYRSGKTPGKGDRRVVLDLVQNSYRIGEVDIRYSRGPLNAALRDFGSGLLVTLIGLLLVLNVVVFLVASSITRPLYRMMNALRSIGSGNFEPYEEIGAEGELAVLSAAIDGLRAQIKEREERIRVVCEESAGIDVKYRLERQRFELEQAQRIEAERMKTELEQLLEDLRRTQAQLVASEKMALLGSLVAGVAHEINTPVGICVTAASFIEERTRERVAELEAAPAEDPGHLEFAREMRESMDLVLSNLRKAAEIIRGFKQVSVDQASEALRDFDLREYLDEIVRSLHPKLKGKACVVRVDCPEDLCLSSYPGAISQILTNLIINSLIHGFRGRAGGTIDISARLGEDGRLRLGYADDGNGVPEEELPRLFEPFRTSMRNEGGSGLGTYIVYNIVTQRLKGHIEARNAPGLSYSIDFPVDVVDRARCR